MQSWLLFLVAPKFFRPNHIPETIYCNYYVGLDRFLGWFWDRPIRDFTADALELLAKIFDIESVSKALGKKKDDLD